MTKKLNIGCGEDIKPGYVNLDILRLDGVDVVHDITEFPYPFDSNTFDEVYADNVLEHTRELSKVMKEIHRILRPGGKLIVKVPYFSQVGAFSDPTHKRFFTFYTMDYFCGLKRSYYHDFEFKMIRKEIKFLFEYKTGIKKVLLWLIYLFPWIVYKISMGSYVWFLSYLFPASELEFEVEKC